MFDSILDYHQRVKTCHIKMTNVEINKNIDNKLNFKVSNCLINVLYIFIKL